VDAKGLSPRLLGLGLVVLVVIAAGFAYWRDRGLPTYEDGEEAPVEGIAVNTLTLGEATYTSGPFEFSLEVVEDAFDLAWTRRIGWTSRGLGVYRPRGHDSTTYVITRGEMTADTVYRDRSAGPAGLADLNVASLELIWYEAGRRSVKRTDDPALIRELVSTLVAGASVPAGSLDEVRLAHVRLLSEQLPGLAYFAYVVVDHRGAVYLARRAEEDSWWLTASGEVSSWLAASD
jgi:hypothetical protein